MQSMVHPKNTQDMFDDNRKYVDNTNIKSKKQIMIGD